MAGRNKISIMLACIFCWPLNIFAQNKISGKVIDKSNGEPIEFAIIKDSADANNIALSNKDGNFKLESKETNPVLSVSCIGYHSVKAGFASSGGFEIALEKGSIDLQEIYISSRTSSQSFRSISQVDLQLKPVNSSQELLRLVPGLFIAQHQGGGKAEQIFIRGFDADHGTDIDISVDGVPVNMVSHAHGQGYADLHFVIPELVKDIDYGKGPYYTTHGDFNTAGYVNLQTINRLERNTVQLTAGAFNTFRALAMLNITGANDKKQNAYLAGEFLYSDGPFKSPQHFNRLNIFGKYTREISTSTKIRATISVMNSDWNASGQIPERAVKQGLIGRFGSIDSSEGGYTSRSNFYVNLSHRFSNGGEIENLSYYTRYSFSLFSDFTFFLKDTTNGDQIHQREYRNLLGDRINFRQENYFGKWHLTSAAGLGVRLDFTNNSELSHTKQRREILQNIQLGNIREANTYAYLDEQLQSGKWLFNFGTRIDHFNFDYFDKLNSQNSSDNKIIASPKLNIEYTLNPHLQFYFKSGKGFHSNDTRVVTASNNYVSVPPAYGTDIGILAKPSQKLLINAALWYLYLDQEFVYAGDDGQVEPSGKTKRMGLDISARWQFSKHLFADGNLNLARARTIGDPKGQNYIALAPILTSTGGIGYQSRKGFNGSLRYRLISDRPANQANSIVAKGYFLLDAVLNYTHSRFECGIIAENILNSEWNEAQFATTSRLKGEPQAVTELHFTPGTPLFLKARIAIFFK